MKKLMIVALTCAVTAMFSSAVFATDKGKGGADDKSCGKEQMKLEDVSAEGKLMAGKDGKGYVLEGKDKVRIADTKSVDLTKFEGKQVKVTGQGMVKDHKGVKMIIVKKVASVTDAAGGAGAAVPAAPEE